jgi:hypothetical protein
MGFETLSLSGSKTTDTQYPMIKFAIDAWLSALARRSGRRAFSIPVAIPIWKQISGSAENAE